MALTKTTTTKLKKHQQNLNSKKLKKLKLTQEIKERIEFNPKS